MRFFKSFLFFIVFSLSYVSGAFAQQEGEFSSQLDSARALEDSKEDTVILSAEYVRYATLEMLKKATYTKQIDTTHVNFHYYNPQNNPWNPSINLGSYGLATRDLLFQPTKTIGFQTGFHALERYLLHADSTKYYRARARYSELSAVGFFFDDQVFRAILSQNINPRWNVGAEYHATNTEGYYNNQEYNDRKGNVYTWYESESLRYNLLVNATFNSLDAGENGSILNDTVFRDPENPQPYSLQTRLRQTRENRPYNKWTDKSLFLRQSYYLGRLDTLHKGEPNMEIHPTNTIAHNSSIRHQRFLFFKNEEDLYGAFPFGDDVLVQDTTSVVTVSNELTYSFYLRNKSLKKNEARLDLGFENDLIWFQDSAVHRFYQNNIIKGELGYKFSDRIDFSATGEQIILGHNFGDFLYEGRADIALGENIGKISLGVYSQNKSPERVFEKMNYTYHQWAKDFSNTKTQNLSFQYKNPKIGFKGKAEYYLVSDYLYFKEVENPNNNPQLDRAIEPAQHGTLNVLKLTVGQNFKLGNFHLDNLAVYQKSEAMDILAIPELYTWHSLYYGNILYNVMDFRIGLDVKFNTPFRTPSYAINAGQFYNDNVGIEFSTYPIADVWLTSNIERVNLFLSYNFVNQHVYPKGYYTVRRYPMNPAFLRFGVSWKFYD
ncbi:MAG TPA: putative porin [Sphingobacterium sp.]|nr:putative porin [Sphingobacterium sp.]